MSLLICSKDFRSFWCLCLELYLIFLYSLLVVIIVVIVGVGVVVVVDLPRSKLHCWLDVQQQANSNTVTVKSAPGKENTSRILPAPGSSPHVYFHRHSFTFLISATILPHFPNRLQTSSTITCFKASFYTIISGQRNQLSWSHRADIFFLLLFLNVMFILSLNIEL